MKKKWYNQVYKTRITIYWLFFSEACIENTVSAEKGGQGGLWVSVSVCQIWEKSFSAFLRYCQVILTSEIIQITKIARSDVMSLALDVSAVEA